MSTPTELIRDTYGDDLPAIERRMGEIVEQVFLDSDGFTVSYINKRTLEPFQDDDPEVNQKPIHEQWYANGHFPYELKRTCLNYEDSDMAAGDYLMALMSRHRATGDADTAAKARALFRAMVRLYDTVAETNPYGAGFLPKPYGGIGRAHECFDTSWDQYFKFTVAMEKYAQWTTDAQEQAKVADIVLSFAQWWDVRDFAIGYSHGRLAQYMHGLGYFAYVMALGHQISGNDHFRQEALFFRDRMLEHGKLSPGPNSQNLVVEIADRLVDLMPEFRQAWLGVMKREWDNRGAHIDAAGIAHFYGYTWNFGARLASTYNTIVKHFPETAGDLDLERLLLNHNHVGRFIHQIAADDPDNTTFPDHEHAVVCQSYACWLRAYWESPIGGKICLSGGTRA